MEPIHLEFTSTLSATQAQAWDWVRSMQGVLTEMRPLLRMSAPTGVCTLDQPQAASGQRLFRSRLYLFGFVPIGHSDLTFLSWTEGTGFVEESPMTGMRSWRHERTIAPTATGCQITDRLTFEPRFARGAVAWGVQRFFDHRHAVLRKNLN